MKSSKDKYQSLRKALSLYDCLERNSFQSASTLGKAVGVSSRTAQDYLKVFREQDWPIESSHAKGYRLSVSTESAHLSQQELLFLAILLAQGSTVLPKAEFEKLALKLTEMLTPTAQSQVQDFHDKVSTPTLTSQSLQTLTAVGRCLADPRIQIVMLYQKPDEPEPIRRNIVPITLRYQDEVCYVDSFDLDKQGTRSYRLDRFVLAQLLRQDQPIPRPGQGITETHKWDFGSDEFQEVKIQLSPRLAAWLEEQPAHPGQSVRTEGNHHFATFQVKRLELFVDWLMGLRGAMAVSPPGLVKAVKRRVETIVQTGGTLGVEWE